MARWYHDEVSYIDAEPYTDEEMLGLYREWAAEDGEFISRSGKGYAFYGQPELSGWHKAPYVVDVMTKDDDPPRIKKWDDLILFFGESDSDGGIFYEIVVPKGWECWEDMRKEKREELIKELDEIHSSKK